MKRFAILTATILFVLVSTLPAVAQTGAVAEKVEKSQTMTMYHMVIVKKGSNWKSQHTQEGADIRMDIINNIKKAAKEGLVITAGLVNDETDAEFIIIFNIKNKYEALELMNKSKNIKNGMFKAEIYSMFAPTGLAVNPAKIKE